MVKGSKEVLLKKVKGLMMIIIRLIILGTFLIQFGGSSMSGLMNTSSTVLTNTYLSSETVLKEINNRFSSMENQLYEEIEGVESNHPGYDEHILNNEEIDIRYRIVTETYTDTEYIGHNVHELLSYITARYGEVKSVSEVQGILDELFKSMYRIEYKEDGN